jgi:hypothetical protein
MVVSSPADDQRAGACCYTTVIYCDPTMVIRTARPLSIDTGIFVHHNC